MTNSTTPTRRPPQPGYAEITTLVVTNAIKIGGLGVALHEIFAGPPDPRTKVLAVAMVMMAGAQGLESFFRALITSPPK